MAAIESLEKRGLNFKLIPGSKAESFENFAESTLTRFGLRKYQDVFTPILRNLHVSPNRESQVEKFFGIIKKIKDADKYSDFLDNLNNTNPRTTIGIAKHFDPEMKVEGTVGGFFVPDTRQIFLDPIFSEMGSENENAEIIIHEMRHAGAFTGGLIQMDETPTQKMTEVIMLRLGYKQEFGAYKSLMSEITEIRDGKNENFTWEELGEAYASFGDINSENFVGDKQDKFYDFLAMLASRDIDKYGIELFNKEKFESRVQVLISNFLRLFPRLAKVIDLDGSFITQSEKEVATIRFDDEFAKKLNSALAKRINESLVLQGRMFETIKNDVQIEYVELLKSELKIDPRTPEGKYYLSEEISERIYKRYSSLPEEFDNTIIDLIRDYIDEDHESIIDNFARTFSPV